MINSNPVTLIAAMSRNRAIGLDNTMPWHLPEDLQHFKARTMGKVMIMGRKTFQSIGRPLPGRITIIVSRSIHHHGFDPTQCIIVPDLNTALDKAAAISTQNQEIMITGGGQIYSAALPYATGMALTRIESDFEGDTFFPAWSPHDWTLVSQADHKQPNSPHLSYSFLEYERRFQGES